MKTRTKSSLLITISYSTAIALAGFSGAVATYGMTKLVPGGELVVAGMGVLFEAGKLTSFALLHKKMPRTLKGALLAVGTTLMVANIAGVSGFLSGAYEHRQIGAKATNHIAQADAHASADLIERQLAAAESNLAAGRAALIKARDNRGRVKAAQAVITNAAAERDALVAKLEIAHTIVAQAEGTAIETAGEFAAVQFIAAATGASPDTIAHRAILTISAIPDCLAVLLLLAAGYAAPRAAAKGKPVHARKAAVKKHRPARPAALKVVEA